MVPFSSQNKSKEEEEQQQQQQEAPIHGDVLEAVVSHVPLIDLGPACHVSKEWYRAVYSSIRNHNRIKPWLMVHTQSPCVKTTTTTTHAYDPRSHVWVEIRKPPMMMIEKNVIPTVRSSSHSTVLYKMTPSKMSVSFDPLNVTWHDLKGSRVWRTDPIVAVVGSRVVVAGGTCDFEDNKLAVEMYDLDTKAWTTCQSMPFIFENCASATWLSVAANDHKMFVTERSSGATCSFDTRTGNWEGPYDLRPDPCTVFSTVGFANNRLILVGLIGEDDDEDEDEDVKIVKLWEVSGESLEIRSEIGEMPMAMVKKMMGENSLKSSIGVSCAGDFVYLYNPSEPEEIVLCEIGGSGGCRWESVRNVVVNDTTRMGKFLFTSSKVEIHDLQRAFRVGNWKFNVKCRV